MIICNTLIGHLVKPPWDGIADMAEGLTLGVRTHGHRGCAQAVATNQGNVTANPWRSLPTAKRRSSDAFFDPSGVYTSTALSVFYGVVPTSMPPKPPWMISAEDGVTGVAVGLTLGVRTRGRCGMVAQICKRILWIYSNRVIPF
jgi:hypothetical protein